MGHQLRFRGPDDDQCFVDDHLSLVFRRLSIIDVAGGRQPIWNEDETLCVVVNGEIYNHRDLHGALRGTHHFRTHSDSEIVLHLYEERGPAALDLLQGMFAIVVWDARKKRLFLARDRFGIKPLYYCATDEQILFGSELKALLAHPDCPRRILWRDLNAPSPFRLQTFIEGVEQLPGGHYLEWEPGRPLVRRCWWSPDRHFSFAPDPGRTTASYVEEYEALLSDAVERHLMSDVTVGAFLSGGLDSSTIVARALKINPDLHCFSVLQDSMLTNGDADAAREVAAALGCPMHILAFDQTTITDEIGFSLDTLEWFVWLMDMPRFSFDWFFKHELHRYARTRLPGLKVILSGQGSDEFAGGYSNPEDARHGAWGRFEQFLTGEQTEGLRRDLPEWLSAMSRPDYRSVEPGQEKWTIFQREAYRHWIALQSYNLWLEDRASSAQSVELRVPFLDHRLVERLLSLPPDLHPELLWDKEIVRRAAARWLPEKFARRIKVQFFHSSDESSLVRLQQIMIRRVFPAFREKYLDRADSMLSAERMQGFCDHLLSGQPSRYTAELFFMLMTTAIFERMCNESSRFELTPLQPPSRLAERELQPEPEPDETLPDPGVHVALSPWLALERKVTASPRAQLQLTQAWGTRKRMKLDPDQLWVQSLLEQLADNPEGLTIGELASRIGHGVEEVQEAVAELELGGWLARR